MLEKHNLAEAKTGKDVRAAVQVSVHSLQQKGNVSPPHRAAGDVLMGWFPQFFLCLPVFSCYIWP